MKQKVVYIILAVICILVIGIACFIISDKKLNLDSKTINKLYNYLGSTDIYHCGGLITYGDKTITNSDLSLENTLCMAYYNLDGETISSGNFKVTGKNSNNLEVCKIGEDATLATSDDKKEKCYYSTFNKDSLNKAYNDLYGKNIDDYTKFSIASDKICVLDKENYYCGVAENFNYYLAPDATIMRLKNKAIKKHNGDIVIYDYFLKIADNKCYSSNTTTEENTNCTNNIPTDINNIDAEFVKKYGTLYKHTFKAAKNDEYYWLQSEIKN